MANLSAELPPTAQATARVGAQGWRFTPGKPNQTSVAPGDIYRF